MANLFSFGTSFGGVNVAPDAAEDFQGLIEELERAGAPLKKIGSYNYRNIAGTNILSEHAKGKAIDVGNQQARDVVDPEFRQWVEENPERYSQILQKYNMRGGESFRNPDLGHIEWRGEGAGNPMHEAAPLGGAMPSNYDTEDRTAVGLGGSRAYAPEEEAVADATGRPRGILDMMGMPQGPQQPGGLLGMLGDPETMAYLAMIAKGASPYSNLDPNAMLSNAHTMAMKKAALQQQQAEQARDNARADRALGLREQEYGLARTDRQERDAALFEERQQKRDLAAKQKEVDDEVRRNLGGGPREAATDEAVAAVPEGTRSPEEQIDQLNRELAKNPSPAIAKSIERRIEQLQKGPPASTLNLITKAENEIAPLQATRDKLERMQTLLPNILEGPLSGAAATVSQYGPAAWRNPQAEATLEFNNLAAIETIRDMSRTMKGSTAVKEMDVWLTKAADPKLPRKIREENLNLATAAVNREIALRENRIKQLQEGTYGRKQTPKADEGGGGGVGDPLGIR